MVKLTKIHVEKGPDPTDIQNTWNMNDWNRAAEAAKCYEIENPIFEKTEKLQLMKDYIQEKSRKHHEKRRVTELQDLHAEQQAQAEKLGGKAGIAPMNPEQAQVLIQLYAAKMKALQPGGTMITKGASSSAASSSGGGGGIIPQQLVVGPPTSAATSSTQKGKGPTSGGTLLPGSSRAADGAPSTTAPVAETKSSQRAERQRARRAAQRQAQRAVGTEGEEKPQP